VIVAVVPYVPTPELSLLQRDTFAFEQPLAYDGGPDGTAILRRVIKASSQWLRPGGTLLLELGGDQAEALDANAEILRDEDGDVRGIELTR
jgi:release factor glutamine methyltransferase